MQKVTIKTSGRQTTNIKTRLYLLFILVILSLVGFFSCLKDSNNTNDFLIRVDSVKAPEIVTSGIPFDIQFFGTIGFDDCTSLLNINQVIIENDINIEALGRFEYKNRTCNSTLVTLNGIKLSIKLSVPGVYRLLIAEPENSTLVKAITVI